MLSLARDPYALTLKHSLPNLVTTGAVRSIGPMVRQLIASVAGGRQGPIQYLHSSYCPYCFVSLRFVFSRTIETLVLIVPHTHTLSLTHTTVANTLPPCGLSDCLELGPDLDRNRLPRTGERPTGQRTPLQVPVHIAHTAARRPPVEMHWKACVPSLSLDL